MATHTTTPFQLNSPVPIDTRLVVGGTNSFYSDKDDITYKYDGLRVWDLTGSSPGNPGTPYVYYDGVWEVEGSSAISGTGSAGYLPKFDSGSSLSNSIITENSSNIGIGFLLTDTLSAKLHINGTVKSEGNGFYGRGSNITNINASNISSGILSLPRLQNGSPGQVLTAGASSPVWENMEENVIDITYNDLKNLKTNNTLSPGVRYYITDRDIWIDALDTDKLAMECKRHFRIVKYEYYTPHTVPVGFFNLTNGYLGIYGQTLQRGSVPNSNNAYGGTFYFAIWGGRMWQRNTSGLDNPGTSNEIIAGGWTMQSITNNTYYESKIFDIKYNFDDDIIWEQSDDRGNIVRRESSTTSYIDITDWSNTKIYNNQCTGVYNNFNSGIFNNSNDGGIFNNSNGGGIFNNSNNGNIRDNLNNGDIQYNSNSGNIQYNPNGGSIFNNSNNGDIYSNSNNGGIGSNANIGGIYSNSNNGGIYSNSNIGGIYINSNGGNINSNSNIGNINNNSNISGVTNIRFNTNSGYISRNRMSSSYKLEYNNNNGNIGVLSGTITRNADIVGTTTNI